MMDLLYNLSDKGNYLIMRVQNVNIEIIREAAKTIQTAEISKSFPKIGNWVNGDIMPTVNQLIKLAKAANIPFGYFFLESLPSPKYTIPHYRTLYNKNFEASINLSETIEIVKERQQWAKDILVELGNEPLYFAGKTTIESSVEQTALLIQEILEISGGWAENLPRWTDALKMLIKKTENAGIFVMVNGVVGNNTRRKLDVKEFRGFVLYDDVAPFIFINGTDTISGKIFTLIHEIVHILVGVSASFDLHKLNPASNKTEIFCDKVTAEFLVPKNQILQQVKMTNIDYVNLSRVFKVSQIVIARRLLDIGYISKADYFEFYDDYIQKEYVSSKKKGGNFYNIIPYRVSKKFFNLIHTSVKQNRIFYRDAFRLTGLKSKTYDEYLNRDNS